VGIEEHFVGGVVLQQIPRLGNGRPLGPHAHGGFAAKPARGNGQDNAAVRAPVDADGLYDEQPVYFPVVCVYAASGAAGQQRKAECQRGGRDFFHR